MALVNQDFDIKHILIGKDRKRTKRKPWETGSRSWKAMKDYVESQNTSKKVTDDELDMSTEARDLLKDFYDYEDTHSDSKLVKSYRFMSNVWNYLISKSKQSPYVRKA